MTWKEGEVFSIAFATELITSLFLFGNESSEYISNSSIAEFDAEKYKM